MPYWTASASSSKAARSSEVTGMLRVCAAASAVVCAFFFLSCAPSDPAAGFARKLKSTDTTIAAGETEKALKILVSLRKSASSASNWLSIAKRERSLDRYDQAETTLRKALHRLPANESVTAVLVDTLIEEKKFTEAAGFSDILRSTRHTPLLSYAGIHGAEAVAGLGAADPQWWQWAHDATGNPLFRRNAAVMHAVAGNFAAACSLAPVDPDRAYFNALLCYDANFDERVFVHLPVAGIGERTARELSLMADSASRLEDRPLGRVLWATLVLRHPGYSPLPYYNLSVTSENAYDEKTVLESCLSLFPSYYPAVARYVRSVPPPLRAGPTDPVAAELARSGFMTLDAEDGLLYSPVDADRAAGALERALAAEDAAADMRLQLESFRFAYAHNSDTIRSASQMWKLLETTGNDPVVHRYAVWYFSSIRNFDSAFTLNRALGEGAIPFYTAMEAAAEGDLDAALAAFALAADTAGESCPALANIARIRVRRNEFAAAIEDLSVATGLTDDDRIKSALQYETALILSGMHMPGRSASIAGYALELDPSNYRAARLLEELDAIR